MPRMNRLAIGDTIYYVINRANGRATIMKTDKDYAHFESLLEEAPCKTPNRSSAPVSQGGKWGFL